MRRFSRLFVAAGLCGPFAAPATVSAATPADLVRVDRATLDALYAQGTVGAIPTGFLPGRAIPDPGSRNTARKSKRIGRLWQGKVFHGDGIGHNRVFGFADAIPVKVYVGESWRDGGPAIIVDYADSWRVFAKVRDEIREVEPGLFVGLTYVRKCPDPKLVMYFALQAPGCAACR